MKKIDAARLLMSRSEGTLACPHCRGGLTVSPSGGLSCPRGHSFDIARQGYVNLLAGAPPDDYGAAMLRSRRAAIAAGLYDGLMGEITAILTAQAQRRGLRRLALLDAGAGEGSLLAGIAGRVAAGGLDCTAAGVDISRDGVRMAAAQGDGILWCVGDIANLPFADGVFDAVINILSPSNYAEFGRVLRAGGLLVKAVPGAQYLVELRRALFAGEEKEAYTNAPVVRHFAERFRAVERRQVRETHPVPPELAPHLAAMTPLTWSADGAAVERAMRALGEGITMDFAVLVGEKEG